MRRRVRGNHRVDARLGRLLVWALALALVFRLDGAPPTTATDAVSGGTWFVLCDGSQRLFLPISGGTAGGTSGGDGEVPAGSAPCPDFQLAGDLPLALPTGLRPPHPATRCHLPTPARRRRGRRSGRHGARAPPIRAGR